MIGETQEHRPPEHHCVQLVLVWSARPQRDPPLVLVQLPQKLPCEVPLTVVPDQVVGKPPPAQEVLPIGTAPLVSVLLSGAWSAPLQASPAPH